LLKHKAAENGAELSKRKVSFPPIGKKSGDVETRAITFWPLWVSSSRAIKGLSSRPPTTELSAEQSPGKITSAAGGGCFII
jgi:hypothetical protein